MQRSLAMAGVALLLAAGCADHERDEPERASPSLPPALVAPRACDDRGAIVEAMVLTLVADPESACLHRIERLPDPLEPARFWLELDGIVLEEGADGYRLTADLLELLGGACEDFSSADSGMHVLRARYGPCR